MRAQGASITGGRLGRRQQSRSFGPMKAQRSNGKARPFGKKSAVLDGLDDSLQSKPAVQGNLEVLSNKRRICPRGKAFYRCANGFEGCCTIDPCNPGGSCPDSREHHTKTKVIQSTTHTTTSVLNTSQASVVTTTSMTSSVWSISKPTFTKSTASGLRTSATSKSTATTSSSGTVSATSPPPCPAGNGTTFADSSKTNYTIHCNSDNTYDTNKTIKVDLGGYDECFSACSNSDACAGFTFKGMDSGTCYLKAQMPQDKYVVKDGSGYVSCAKVDGTAPAPDVPTSSSSKSNHITTIVGGVFGGVGFILLLLLLIAFLARRHRKKIEQRRTTISHGMQGPFESDQLNVASHQRQGSSSHDVFQPFGGFYQGWSKGAPEIPEQKDPQVEDKWKGGTSPGMRAEVGTELVPLIYQPSMPQQRDRLAMPDAAAFRTNSRDSGSRSPRFHENLDDDPYQLPLRHVMPPSPANDSPTLGRNRVPAPAESLADQVRRQQHLVYQTPSKGGTQHNAASSYAVDVRSDGTNSTRTGSPVSPVSNGDPLDPAFVVSPLFNSNKKDKWWNGYQGPS